MLDFIITILIAIVFSLIAYFAGLANGWREVHKQEIICQTMPDKEIYCYANKNEKEIK